LGPLGGSREEEGFALRVFAGRLRGDGGGFGVVFERVIEEATRRRKGMSVRKQKDSTEEEKTEEREGLAKKGSETLNAEKKKTKQRNIPQRMVQTGNG